MVSSNNNQDNRPVVLAAVGLNAGNFIVGTFYCSAALGPLPITVQPL